MGSGSLKGLDIWQQKKETTLYYNVASHTDIFFCSFHIRKRHSDISPHQRQLPTFKSIPSRHEGGDLSSFHGSIEATKTKWIFMLLNIKCKGHRAFFLPMGQQNAQVFLKENRPNCVAHPGNILFDPPPISLEIPSFHHPFWELKTILSSKHYFLGFFFLSPDVLRGYVTRWKFDSTTTTIEKDGRLS